MEELIEQVTDVLPHTSYLSLSLSLQAERELSLAHKMEEWEPWQPLVSEPPPGQWKWL